MLRRFTFRRLRMPLAPEAPPAIEARDEPPWLEFRQRLRVFVSRRVSNPADVEDIVQWVLLQLHRNLEAMRRGDRMHAWLYRTARHAVADYYRGRHRRREVPSGDALDLDRLGGGGPGRGEAIDDGSRPVAECLAPMVEGLPTIYREAIVLTEVQGMRLHAAASVAALSLSGMKSRVQRARRRLRADLLECCHLALDRRGAPTGCERRPER